MTTKDKKEFLESRLRMLEEQRLDGEVDYRTWDTMVLASGGTKNDRLLSAHSMSKKNNEMLDTKIRKTKELIKELNDTSNK